MSTPLDRMLNPQVAAVADEFDRRAAEITRLREREAHFAQVLGVADGGQYRNDWDAAIQRVLDERDRLKGALASAEGERIALADAFREYLVESVGWSSGAAALKVQGIIDNAEPKRS